MGVEIKNNAVVHGYKCVSKYLLEGLSWCQSVKDSTRWTLYSHYSPEQSFSLSTIDLELLSVNVYCIKHCVCRISQSNLFIIPVKRAMAKEELMWRTKKRLPKLCNYHHVLQAIIVKWMEQEIADYFLNVKWSGLSGGWVSAGTMETDNPWILQLCTGEAPAATTAASPALWGKENVQGIKWGGCSSPSPLSRRLLLSFTLAHLYFWVKCPQRCPSS